MTARTMAGSKPLMSVLSYFDINNFDVRLIQPKSRLSLLSWTPATVTLKLTGTLASWKWRGRCKIKFPFWNIWCCTNRFFNWNCPDWIQRLDCPSLFSNLWPAVPGWTGQHQAWVWVQCFSSVLEFILFSSKELSCRLNPTYKLISSFSVILCIVVSTFPV